MSSTPTTSGSTILDFSPPLGSTLMKDNIFQDITQLRSKSDAFTGFIAGYDVGNDLPEHGKVVHLSASSTEDPEPHNKRDCLDVTEEASAEEDEDEEMEMRISEGSVYPAAFSFISMNEVPPHHKIQNSTVSTELDSTNSSTLDYTGSSAQISAEIFPLDELIGEQTGEFRFPGTTEEIYAKKSKDIFSRQMELDLFAGRENPAANSTVMLHATDEDFFQFDDKFKIKDSRELLFFKPTSPNIDSHEHSNSEDFFAPKVDEAKTSKALLAEIKKVDPVDVEDLDELNEEFVRRISVSSHESSRKDVQHESIERSESFGEFADQPAQRGIVSSSSAESFGSFDDGPDSDTEVWREADSSSPLTSYTNACEQCFPPTIPLPSSSPPSPKHVLRSNFVWTKTRAQVTKPSYRWDQLKLSSYLLGALGVRKPITLNRLRNTTGPGPGYIGYTGYTVASGVTPAVKVQRPSPMSPPMSPEPKPKVEPELKVEPDHRNGPSSVQDDRSDMSSTSSRDSDSPNKLTIPQCCKPLPSVIKMKFSSHRRVNSTPVFKSSSPMTSPLGRNSTDTRSLTSSPRVLRKDGMSNSSSMDSSFDQSHAARGLQLLDMCDIESMRCEMQCKVGELSATLIKEFQYRGDADHSREVKTAFVAALLAAEEKKSKGQLTTRQLEHIPLRSCKVCPSTEILVLLTQVLLALAGNTPHLADLINHYKSQQ